ncbi:MAG TPA: ferrous iron transport protein B [Candidatus Aphodocola excrementigallinarum]|uniref:Ferrous iron transport protein B n=1 Tax=Candidatus Aphodocola excrementigallinarum TaxID=2840670 RepID=A0A9D1LHH8_9FIRM|nr:ferrous iron transport protein B [Candidatus Aphodocola excrementigallinarum]
MKNNEKTITLIGNPNVGKSTIFNALTGLNQHTGNWPGKTVEVAEGSYIYNKNKYNIIDLPGTYSLFASSKEEEVASDFICFNKTDLIVLVLDATILERNLNLATQIIEAGKNTLICLNLCDEAKKKNIKIDDKALSKKLKVPVIKTAANDKKSIKKLLDKIEECTNKEVNINNNIITYDEKIEDIIKKMNMTLKKYSKKEINNFRFYSIKVLEKNKNFNEKIYKYLKIDKSNYGKIENIIDNCLSYLKENNINDYQEKITSLIVQNNNNLYKCLVKQNDYKTPKIDKILTSKIFGIPIMILFLALILWITIKGANYPSEALSKLLFSINDLISDLLIKINTPNVIHDILINGVLKTLFWVVSVMLPPMAIFFPLFTLLEDAGFLPRIAFNLDKLFNKAKCHGKQALTMCMGLGCNACGVTGARIIDSPRERLIAILTNVFTPCNGRFPSLIAIITMFFVSGSFSSIKSSIILTLVLILSVFITLLTSKFLSKTILKGMPSNFVLEMPPYRKPNIKKVIVRSVIDRVLFVLLRAISVAAPAGLIIWLLSNIHISGSSLFSILTNFLDPIAYVFGLDGTILMAFILGFPANEIVIPIIIMGYLNGTSITDYSSLLELKSLLVANGWTIKTAICTLIFTLFHFPCSTTILTIKKETKSNLWTIIAFVLPTIIGLILCFIINLIFNLF